jgi:hypothetical protein
VPVDKRRRARCKPVAIKLREVRNEVRRHAEDRLRHPPVVGVAVLHCVHALDRMPTIRLHRVNPYAVAELASMLPHAKIYFLGA